MSIRAWRLIAWVYHAFFLFFVIWPGQALLNKPTPLIIGLPRQMFWAALWITGSLVVFWRLDRAEAPFRDHGSNDVEGDRG